MSEKHEWLLTLTRRGESGREVGRYASRNAAMLAAQHHFDSERQSKNKTVREELGWQMSFASATSISSIGAYRVLRADLRTR